MAVEKIKSMNREDLYKCVVKTLMDINLMSSSLSGAEYVADSICDDIMEDAKMVIIDIDQK